MKITLSKKILCGLIALYSLVQLGTLIHNHDFGFWFVMVAINCFLFSSFCVWGEGNLFRDP